MSTEAAPIVTEVPGGGGTFGDCHKMLYTRKSSAKFPLELHTIHKQELPVAWVAGDVTAHPSGHVLSGLLWDCAWRGSEALTRLLQPAQPSYALHLISQALISHISNLRAHLACAQTHSNLSSTFGASTLSFIRKTENEGQAWWDDDVSMSMIEAQVGSIKATYTPWPLMWEAIKAYWKMTMSVWSRWAGLELSCCRRFANSVKYGKVK